MMRSATHNTVVQTQVSRHGMEYDAILARGFPFTSVRRVSFNDTHDLLETVERMCVDEGTPLVIEGWHKHPDWQSDLFDLQTLEQTYGDEEILCRDQTAACDVKMTMADYIKRLNTTQSRAHHAKRIYAKDLTCLPRWRSFLDGILPPWMTYMGKNDLLGFVPDELVAENLMVYIGADGTWTPAHFDQCGVIGQNIMTFANKDSFALWFMIDARDISKAQKLWESFGHSLDNEAYFASVNELQSADFPVYVVQQKLGDVVMVPSLCVHQVINSGPASIKVSWNRMTAPGMDLAVNVVLPRYQEICRPEGYRIKLIIQHALDKYTDLLNSGSNDFPVGRDRFARDFRTLMTLFRRNMEDEWINLNILSGELHQFTSPQSSMQDMAGTCDFCKADIWNRQFYCSRCVTDKVEDDHTGYDLCLRCYSLGRGCKHRSEMHFIEAYSMRSCRELWCRAAETWNRSLEMQQVNGFTQVPVDLKRKILSPRNQPYSVGTVAYFRYIQVLQKRKQPCHYCKEIKDGLESLRCSRRHYSRHVFCEECMFKEFGEIWSEIKASREDWTCYICLDRCTCADCKPNKGKVTAKRHSTTTVATTTTAPPAEAGGTSLMSSQASSSDNASGSGAKMRTKSQSRLISNEVAVRSTTPAAHNGNSVFQATPRKSGSTKPVNDDNDNHKLVEVDDNHSPLRHLWFTRPDDDPRNVRGVSDVFPTDFDVLQPVPAAALDDDYAPPEAKAGHSRWASFSRKASGTDDTRRRKKVAATTSRSANSFDVLERTGTSVICNPLAASVVGATTPSLRDTIPVSPARRAPKRPRRPSTPAIATEGPAPLAQGAELGSWQHGCLKLLDRHGFGETIKAMEGVRDERTQMMMDMYKVDQMLKQAGGAFSEVRRVLQREMLTKLYIKDVDRLPMHTPALSSWDQAGFGPDQHLHEDKVTPEWLANWIQAIANASVQDVHTSLFTDHGKRSLLPGYIEVRGRKPRKTNQNTRGCLPKKDKKMARIQEGSDGDHDEDDSNVVDGDDDKNAFDNCDSQIAVPVRRHEYKEDGDDDKADEPHPLKRRRLVRRAKPAAIPITTQQQLAPQSRSPISRWVVEVDLSGRRHNSRDKTTGRSDNVEPDASDSLHMAIEVEDIEERPRMNQTTISNQHKGNNDNLKQEDSETQQEEQESLVFSTRSSPCLFPPEAFTETILLPPSSITTVPMLLDPPVSSIQVEQAEAQIHLEATVGLDPVEQSFIPISSSSPMVKEANILAALSETSTVAVAAASSYQQRLMIQAEMINSAKRDGPPERVYDQEKDKNRNGDEEDDEVEKDNRQLRHNAWSYKNASVSGSRSGLGTVEAQQQPLSFLATRMAATSKETEAVHDEEEEARQHKSRQRQLGMHAFNRVVLACGMLPRSATLPTSPRTASTGRMEDAPVLVNTFAQTDPSDQSSTASALKSNTSGSAAEEQAERQYAHEQYHNTVTSGVELLKVSSDRGGGDSAVIADSSSSISPLLSKCQVQTSSYRSNGGEASQRSSSSLSSPITLPRDVPSSTTLGTAVTTVAYVEPSLPSTSSSSSPSSKPTKKFTLRREPLENLVLPQPPSLSST